MFAKKSAILALLLVAIAIGSSEGVEDHSARYGKFNLNKEGFIKLCLTEAVVTNRRERYASEQVGELLGPDRIELFSHIMDFNHEGFSDCSRKCFRNLVPSVYEVSDLGRGKFIEAECEEKHKFARLSALFEDLKSHDSLVIAKMNWVNKMFDSLRGIDWQKCDIGDSNDLFAEAEKYFPQLLSLTEEQFEQEKLAYKNRLINLFEGKRSHDKEITGGVFAEINAEIEQLLPEYKRCWLEEEIERETKQAKTKRGIFSKIFLCNAGKCEQ